MKKFREKYVKCKLKVLGILRDNKGQGALDTAVVVLISIVLGALILAGLYALIDDTVIPQLQQRITEMFNYTN